MSTPMLDAPLADVLAERAREYRDLADTAEACVRRLRTAAEALVDPPGVESLYEVRAVLEIAEATASRFETLGRHLRALEEPTAQAAPLDGLVDHLVTVELESAIGFKRILQLSCRDLADVAHRVPEGQTALQAGVTLAEPAAARA